MTPFEDWIFVEGGELLVDSLIDMTGRWQIVGAKTLNIWLPGTDVPATCQIAFAHDTLRLSEPGSNATGRLLTRAP